MKNKILLTLAIGLPLVALVHLCAATKAATSETRSFSVIKNEDGLTQVLNQDGTKLSEEQCVWLNGACATNIGTAVDLDRYEITGMTVRQDYNSFGWQSGGDVTFITPKQK